MSKGTFREDLIKLINSHNIEGQSNTPDHILGSYLMGCLENFNCHVAAREIWHGRTDTTPYVANPKVTRRSPTDTE